MDADPKAVRMLARYQLLEEVGHGGMAVVYRGRDTTLDREVAVKILHPHLADVAESRARLQREAQAVAKLRHENILEIYDYSGPESAESYIVTEFIHGKTLKATLGDRPLPFVELAEMIASEVARALEHAHASSIIHRDIKPENVMVRDDGLIKLMDFGIAQIVDKERMTVTGQLLGSPAYMSPEHIDGKPLDFRSDVFSLGILLYQLACGQMPFRGKNPHEVLRRIGDCKFVPPEALNPRIGSKLARIIGRCLARDPADRYADVGPMRKELLEDLADAGVEDARAELARYFAAPDAWGDEFGPRLVATLAQRGRLLAAQGRAAAALDLWSRALATDPKSAEVRALVDGMARRRRWARLVIVAASSLVVAAGVGLGAWQVLGRLGRSSQTNTVGPLMPTPKPTAPTPGVGLPGLRTVTAPTPPVPTPTPKLDVERRRLRIAAAHPTPPVETPVPASPTLRPLELSVNPAAARVAIDDGPMRPYNPSRALDLPNDQKRHTLHVDSIDGGACFPAEVAVEPSQSKLKVELKWKPASLTIFTKPAHADVEVDGKFASAGRPFSVPITSRSKSHQEVAVSVVAEGYVMQNLKLNVEAGKALEKTVELRPEAPTP